ncbi:GNAT family N-acetyltransferase [Georgenia sp. SYP-B2076]|uniref:GNAT family N-acetyltransferase n=1 Tax=Georgenia sp. SYP-B2076 TaxID=2495881 RepID=UPI00197A9310|nr:GNAT family N-acetyltransferase [Georgenia sp. SYP-B2076]
MPETRMSVETARTEDFARVGEICVAAYHEAGVLENPADGYAGTMRDVADRAANAVVLVVRAGREVLGTVTLAAAGSEYADLARGDELELRMLAVDPAAQRRGAAEALLRGAEEWAREHGFPALVLSVLSTDGPGAPHRLYERLGFSRDQSRDYVGSWDPGAQMWFYELTVR